MKILYLHQHFSTPRGATGIRSYTMATQLVQSGHEVAVVCGSYNNGLTGLSGPFKGGCRVGKVNGFEVVEFELPYSNSDNLISRTRTFLSFSLQATKLALLRDYDIIVATTTPLTIAIPGVAARWLRRKRFIFEVRDLWPELPKAMGVIKSRVIIWLLLLLEWVAYHSAHRLIALSPGILDGIIQQGVSGSDVKMIPNGCNLDLVIPTEGQDRPAGVAASDLMAIYSGTHGLANGLDAVLDCAAELQTRDCNDVKFVFVGDGKLKGHLQHRVRHECLSNVIFEK